MILIEKLHVTHLLFRILRSNNSFIYENFCSLSSLSLHTMLLTQIEYNQYLKQALLNTFDATNILWFQAIPST